MGSSPPAVIVPNLGLARQRRWGGRGDHLRHADPEVDDLVWVADLQHGPVRDGLPFVERQRFDVRDGGPPLSGEGAIVSRTQQSLPVQLRRSQHHLMNHPLLMRLYNQPRNVVGDARQLQVQGSSLDRSTPLSH